MEMEKRYMVSNPNGSAPKATHETKEEAINEAKRLAEIHPKSAFFVLEILGVVESKIKIEYKEFSPAHN